MNQIWDDDDTLDLRDLLARLWVRRWWIAASVVFFTALLVFAALRITPIYRASTVLVPTSLERNSLSGSLTSALGQVGSLASLAGVNLGSNDAATQEALAVLRSRQFTERFIVDLKLMPKLFASRWDAVAGTWKADTEPPSLAKAFKYFDKELRLVALDRKTGLVTVNIEWKHPDEAATWANLLVQRLNEEMRGRAIEESDASRAFLERELSGTSLVETREAINRLLEVQIKQRMLANVTHDYAFRVVDQAMAADRDDPIKPNKLLLFAGGPILGFIMGIMAVLAIDWFRSVAMLSAARERSDLGNRGARQDPVDRSAPT